MSICRRWAGTGRGHNGETGRAAVAGRGWRCFGRQACRCGGLERGWRFPRAAARRLCRCIQKRQRVQRGEREGEAEGFASPDAAGRRREHRADCAPARGAGTVRRLWLCRHRYSVHAGSALRRRSAGCPNPASYCNLAGVFERCSFFCILFFFLWRLFFSARPQLCARHRMIGHWVNRQISFEFHA